MSDVLIKGMKMPKSCIECPLETDYRTCCYYSPTKDNNCNYQKRPVFCPLIEVPPHGDLIDRDALEVQDGWLRDSKYFSQDSGHTHITFVYSNDICNAPIIIDAEDGE